MPGRCGRGAWRRTAPAGWSTRGAAALAWPARRPRPPRRLRPSPPGVRADPGGHPTNVPSGWQYPSAASAPNSRSRLSPSWVLEMAAMRPACRSDSRRDDGPDGVQAELQGHRRVPPRPGGRGGVSWARRGGEPGQHRGRQRRAWAVCHGDQTSMAGFDTLPMVWSPSTLGRTEHHGHLTKRRLGASSHRTLAPRGARGSERRGARGGHVVVLLDGAGADTDAADELAVLVGQQHPATEDDQPAL